MRKAPLAGAFCFPGARFAQASCPHTDVSGLCPGLRHHRAMIRLGLLFLLASLTAAAAQGFDGPYGSASDPATSCAANPHQLGFIANPPHAILQWDHPWTDAEGNTVTDRRYDLLGQTATTLTLRLEGDSARTATGARPTWILRLTQEPEGYCWGRQDWPSVHCENQQLVCQKATS